MWIQIDNDATRRLFNDDVMDEPITFSGNGTAQVPGDVGEALVDHYDAIRPYEADDNA